MRRRSFLKRSAAAGLVTFITPRSIVHTFSNKSNPSLLSGFMNPPSSAKPYTWWHWMNGNISKEGITLDLEAMKEAGLGGFQLFDAGTGIVKGPIEYLSEEWLDMMKHALAESERLELEFAMHNCPGWSSSGGPWITPEMSMQQLTWTETKMKGGERIKQQLPQPPHHLGYYRDAKVIAFPSLKGEEMDMTDMVREVFYDSEKMSFDSLINEGITLQPPEKDGSSYIQIELKKPAALRNVTLFTASTGGHGAFYVELSTDGKTFEKVADFSGGAGNYELEGVMAATADFPDQVARFIRLTSTSPRHISNVSASGAARVPGWLRKANFRNAGWHRSAEYAYLSGSIIDPNTVLDLTEYVDQEGNLDWKAPKGRWTVLRIGHTTIGKLNHSAPTTGTGLECDKYSKEAFNFHFKHMFDKLLPLMEGLTQKEKVGLLVDSYEMGLQNWTKTFPEEFEQRRKYSLINYLPTLTGRIVRNLETSRDFLWDFRRTCADLMADNYHGEFDRVCKKYGITSYTEPYGGGPFEEMQVGSRVDYNMGEFWSGHTVLWANIGMKRTMKLAASIAHTNSQKIVGAEAFTAEPGAGKWQQYPYSMKSLGDWMYTQGLNRLIFHRFAHQPHPTARPGMTMGPWGIHFDRTNTWWPQAKAWLLYCSRIQYMLQQGEFVADIAFLTSEEPGISIPTMADQLSYPPPYGYDYDLVSPEKLQDSSITNGQLSLDNGIKYKLLVLPEDETMTMKQVRKLAELVDQGLILVGAKPNSPSGLMSDEEKAEFKGLVRKIWGNVDGDTLKKATSGAGKVYARLPLDQILKDLELSPDFEFTSESNDAPINYIHRRNEGEDFYFIANRRRSSEKLTCSFRVSGKRPEVWDTNTGQVYSYPFYELKDGRVMVTLTLPPSGSALVAFRTDTDQSGVKLVTHGSKQLISTSAFSEPKTALHKDVYNDFCVSVWVKPETDIPLTPDQFFGSTKTDHFVLYPPSGKKHYGEGHANLGLTAGRNGIVVFEREGDEIQDVLSIKSNLSGWTHLAVVYENGVPTIYSNGQLLKKGVSTHSFVHPGLHEAFQADGASYFNGDMSEPVLLTAPFSELLLNQQLAAGPPKFKSVEPLVVSEEGILIHENGSYTLRGTKDKTISVQKAETFDLSQNWKVRFPAGLGAPAEVHLPQLISLHKHKDHGIRHFSGTASYHQTFSLTKVAAEDNFRFILDLGKVEVLAEVVVNGNAFGVVWKPPYSIDISEFIEAGDNTLEVRVTNLWPNRLIGDESLPVENEYEISGWTGKFAVLADGAIKELPEWYKAGEPKPPGGRVSFSTWMHYKKGDPLLESGLIGPVTLRKAFLIPSSQIIEKS